MQLHSQNHGLVGVGITNRTAQKQQANFENNQYKMMVKLIIWWKAKNE